MGLATYPIGLELSAECAYPVSETTSTGLIVLSGQVQSVIYVAAMTILAKPLADLANSPQVCKSPHDVTDAAEAKNWWLSNIVSFPFTLLEIFLPLNLGHVRNCRSFIYCLGYILSSQISSYGS